MNNFVGKFMNGINKFFGVTKEEKKPIKLIPVEEGPTPYFRHFRTHTFSPKKWAKRQSRIAMQKESRKKNRDQ